MSSERFSDAYVNLLSTGPFPGRMDPWAEVGNYFKQIHNSMIGEMLSQLLEPLLKKGYVAARETSLQIAENRQPDLAVWREQEKPEHVKHWDYAAVASELLVEPGITVEGQTPELDAIFISDMESGDLVTILEIISPSNKADKDIIADYSERRERLIQRKRVNFVELDLTRSVKRLLNDILVTTYPYHIAIYLPDERPRVIGINFHDYLKSFALPLRGEAVVVETRAIYDHAYREAFIAPQLNNKGHYPEANLPFPTLLTNQQRQEALAAVAQWQAELQRLQSEG
jgi:hypothetical protein